MTVGLDLLSHKLKKDINLATSKPLITGDDASELEAFLKIASLKQMEIEDDHCKDQLERAVMLCEESLRMRLKILDF